MFKLIAFVALVLVASTTSTGFESIFTEMS